MTDLSRVIDLLEAGRAHDWHDCAQAYVSWRGETLLDAAVGESRAGRGLRTDDVMLWYSSGKPLTAAAVLQLWERGRLGLDDRIGDYVDGWGNGKETATVRHVLTHTGGFPMPTDPTYDQDVGWEETLARIARHRGLWVPGTEAAYHAWSGWRVLGAVVEAVDGRGIEAYLREEIFAPIGMVDTWLGIPREQQERLGDRLVPVAWKGHRMPVHDADGLRMVPYRVDRVHNEPWHVAKVEPGGGMRGPARELGRFYESLLGFGPPVLEPRTVEVMRAVHRYGLVDALLHAPAPPWGLGVAVEHSGGTGRRIFGHSGMASSRAFADPDIGLVVVVVTNGLAGFVPAEQRMLDVTNAVYSALGDEVQQLRKPVETVMQALGLER